LGWFVAAFVGHPGRLRRVVCILLGVVFILVTVAAGVNSHYQYKPTLGSLWGDVGASNVVSEDQLRPSTRGTNAAGQPPTTAAPGCDTIPSTGQVATVQIPGPAAGQPAKDAYVYLPPAWCNNDDTDYPVAIMLHGAPSPEGGKDFLGAMELVKYADAFAADHGGKTPVIVMPNAGSPNDTECADSQKYGKIETYLTTDVPNWIRSWNVLTDRIQPPGKGWIIGGYSMGGTCSLMLALRHPELFQTFADYGGDAFGTGDGIPADQQRTQTIRDLFGGDAQAFDSRDPSKQLTTKKFPAMGGWFGVGGADQGTLRDMRRYYDQAQAAEIAVCFDVIPDVDHTFVAWKPTMANSFPWLAARTGLIPMTPEIQASCKKP
jgi:S-formylglutathione hydrolase FrmB